MHTSATVIDFTLHRKRRQARAAAELMWAMYAARAGLMLFTASFPAQRHSPGVRPMSFLHVIPGT